MNDGEITIRGNLTREVEVRFGQSGNAWATFSVAVSRRRRNKNGDFDEKTKFYNCKVFGQMAENLAESTTKGSRVVVSGYLEDEEWTKDGEKRKSQVLVADEISVSLRFAKVSIERNPSQGGGGGSYGGGGGYSGGGRQSDSGGSDFGGGGGFESGPSTEDSPFF